MLTQIWVCSVLDYVLSDCKYNVVEDGNLTPFSFLSVQPFYLSPETNDDLLLLCDFGTRPWFICLQLHQIENLHGGTHQLSPNSRG